MEPWRVGAKLIEFSGVKLVRVFTKVGEPISPTKPFIDIDPSARLTSHPKAHSVCVEITRSLGYRFPFPISADTYAGIINFQWFPEREKWEAKFGDDEHKVYPLEDYKSDVRLFILSSLEIKTPAALTNYCARLGKTLVNMRGSLCPLTPDNQVAYAASALRLISRKAAEIGVDTESLPTVNALKKIIRGSSLDAMTQSELVSL